MDPYIRWIERVLESKGALCGIDYITCGVMIYL